MAKKHALLSASSAHRWLVCPPSAVAAALYDDTGSVYAEEGTQAHQMAEAAVLGRLEGSGEMAECAQRYADYVHELIRAPRAHLLLEQRVDLSPWIPDGFGTCDCLIIQDSTLIVVDYKYGVGVPVSAVGNPQIRLYALGAVSDFEIAYDFDKVEMHIFQPRLDSISTETMSVEELRRWGDEVVKPAAQQAYDGRGDYTPGSHCKFCPHAGRCRALNNACVESVSVHRARKKVPVLSDWEIAEVLEMEPLINLWLKRVHETALNLMLEGGTVPGYKVVEGRSVRSWLDEQTVLNKLTEAGYWQEEVTKTELLSPAAMEKALGKKRVAELLPDMIQKTSGAPTIAPETDKRPAYDRLAAAREDFKEE